MQRGPTYQRLALSIRPPRVALLVPFANDNWQLRARRCIEELTWTWGGIADLLIPLDANAMIPDAFWPLLELFDPDWLACYYPTWRSWQMASPTEFEKYVATETEKWVKAHGGEAAQFRAMAFGDDDLRHPLVGPLEPEGWFAKRIRRRLSTYRRGDHLVAIGITADTPPHDPLSEMSALVEDNAFVPTIEASSLPDSAQLLLASRLGAIPPAYEARLRERSARFLTAKAEPRHLAPLLQLAWRGHVDLGDWHMHRAAFREEEPPEDPWWTDFEYASKSPFGLTMAGTGWTFNMRDRRSEAPFVVVTGDTLADFCLAYSLGRLYGNAPWLPTELLNGDELFDTTARALGRELRYAARQDRRLLVTSCSVSDNDLDALRPKLEAKALYLHGEELRRVAPSDIPLVSPGRLYWIENLEEIRHEALIDGEMAGLVDTPVARLHPGASPDALLWQVDARVGDITWPARSAVSPILGTGSAFDRDRIRASTGGTSYFSHSRGYIPGGARLEQRLARPKLRVPTAEELFDALLDEGGLRGEDSEAGRFTRGALRLFGSFDNFAAAFKSPTSNAVLDTFRSKKMSGLDPGDYVQRLDRRFLSFEDFVRATNADRSALRRLVDDYVERRILWRGLTLECSECRYVGWYRLEDLGQSFTCTRCRASTMLTRHVWGESDEPTWQYELDELVYQAVLNDARAPVLALDRIRDGSADFLFAPERNIYEKDSGTLVAEIDLLVVRHGRVILGEAKTVDRLSDGVVGEERVARRLFSVADRVGADELVLATTQPRWSEATRDSVRKAAPAGLALTYLENLAP